MTLPQALAFSIVGGAVAMFAWGRFRYDIIALVALLAGFSVGVVPVKRVFSGFTSDVVVIIACALVVSAAVARSGVIEQLLQPVLSRLKTTATQVPVMAGSTALLSMVTKNVGALAILMPVAIRLTRATRTSRSSILMPMSFMSLLGGLVTLVGTSTNIIVSQVREDTLGKPFQMFDFAPVGLALTGIGLVFVSFAWRLLPRDRQGSADMGEALSVPYATEASLPETWPADLATLGTLKLADSGVKATALIRDRKRSANPRGNRRLQPGDTLVLEGDQEALNAVFSRTPLVHEREGKAVDKDDAREEMRSVEAVVQSESVLVGRSAARVSMQQQFGVSLLAVSRSGARISQKLRNVTLRAGDVLILQAGEKALPGALRSLGLLPLVERDVQVSGARRRFLPIAILAVAMVLVAVKIAPVAPAFFGAAVLMVATGSLSMREAYGSLDGQVLILIGALTPLSEAIQSTGGTGLVAGGLAALLHGAPALVTLGILMITAMACAPFLHNAPTVLVLGPIGVALARQLHLNPDPFLMAVATGAGCDFLTPIGHQCNTLVMGPGGYRFGDYARLGLPLSIAVILLGAPLISTVWPLVGH
ncbi:MAG TPA: SLC13 family permease [Caulobacteraceae bacterium]|jgi:di/tricarboxylate transporter|nr:SLC13 family permease [Caulobacteraceae bacterium]